jgi:hypothetical protein
MEASDQEDRGQRMSGDVIDHDWTDNVIDLQTFRDFERVRYLSRDDIIAADDDDDDDSWLIADITVGGDDDNDEDIQEDEAGGGRLHEGDLSDQHRDSDAPRDSLLRRLCFWKK